MSCRSGASSHHVPLTMSANKEASDYREWTPQKLQINCTIIKMKNCTRSNSNYKNGARPFRIYCVRWKRIFSCVPFLFWNRRQRHKVKILLKGLIISCCFLYELTIYMVGSSLNVGIVEMLCFIFFDYCVQN